MTKVVSSEKEVQSILNMDALELAKLIKERKISSLQATKTYITHLEKINNDVNCLVEDRFIEAIAEAKEADKKILNGTAKGKLFGVPISMKESFNVAGMKTTGGLLYRKNLVETEDAYIVTRLKEEGAIILGKTNTPILCFCQETNNKLYGRTNNPWNLDRTAGGSSGGEGALIASGGAAVGVGSDIGGSIRFPAHFNGVIGFKSGDAQVNDEGSFPVINIPLQKRMLGIGALAKSVRDAKLINEIIVENVPVKQELSNFNIVIETRDQSYPINPKTHSLLLDVKKYLQKTFNIIGEHPPLLQETALLWQLMMSVDGADEVAETGFGSKSFNRVTEYLKEITFRSSDLHRYFTWALIGAKMFKPNSKKILETEATIKKGDREINEYLRDRLLVLPVYHSAAPVHGQVYSEIFSIRKTFLRYMPFSSYANVWGLPALTIPVGVDEDNMPIAIQIVSNIGNEDAIFQLGEIIEKEFRGYKRKVFKK